MTNIFIEKGILNTLEYYFKVNFIQNIKLVVVTDDNLHQFYKGLIESLTELAGVKFIKTISIPPGEGSKSREMKSHIEDEMFDSHCTRDTLIIAIGGGVVLDLAGFVAATFCRGIPIIYIPTSLLAQIDAAIGGKTGINTKFGKNLLGAFKQPEAVFISQEFLKTIPDIEYISAFAEVIKHALIVDKNYFNFLYKNADKIKSRNPEFLEKVIKRSLEIKRDIVKKDEKEKNLRAILNFGHTIGHAIERAYDYKINHGQAVAYGILVESYISYKLNFLSKPNYDQIVQIIQLYNIDNLLLPNLDYSLLGNCLNYLKYDKKNINSDIRLVLIKNIGEVVSNNNNYTHPTSVLIIENSLKKLFQKDLINIDASIY